MRCGILIIGSLLWENDERLEWRRQRLDIDQGFTVSAPIHYWRRSSTRGCTFTMTFAGDGPEGHAMLVPCKATIGNVNELVVEAEALWRAERGMPGRIGAHWGCVGVLFHPLRRAKLEKMPEAWAGYFKDNTFPIPPVNGQGMLGIPWPERKDNGERADMDVLLATATKAERYSPSAEDIAIEWLDKGHEDYFFENVRTGIRTPEDDAIWHTIEAAKPDWLRKAKYRDAIRTLQKRD